MKKKPYYHSCTVQRTFKVTHSTLNLGTGVTAEGTTETKTGPCNIPLFGEPFTSTGICRSCAKGWEAPGNVFANDAERARAKASPAR